MHWFINSKSENVWCASIPFCICFFHHIVFYPCIIPFYLLKYFFYITSSCWQSNHNIGSFFVFTGFSQGSYAWLTCWPILIVAAISQRIYFKVITHTSTCWANPSYIVLKLVSVLRGFWIISITRDVIILWFVGLIIVGSVEQHGGWCSHCCIKS